jgi:hypothetical protein
MELTHAGPKDAARQAEQSAPSGVVCSHLVFGHWLVFANILRQRNDHMIS